MEYPNRFFPNDHVYTDGRLDIRVRFDPKTDKATQIFFWSKNGAPQFFSDCSCERHAKVEYSHSRNPHFYNVESPNLTRMLRLLEINEYFTKTR